MACPSVELLPSLVSHPDWERFYTDDVGGNGGGARGGGGNGDNEKPSHPPCIVHLAPEGVLRSREYGEWARRFGSGATHIVTTRPFCPQHSIFQVAKRMILLYSTTQCTRKHIAIVLLRIDVPI